MTRLLLPIAGSAARIGGIPKFLLPISGNRTLIEEHVLSALNADLGGVVVICRRPHFEITKNILEKYNGFVEYIQLNFSTKTMNETISFFEPRDNETNIIIGLADSYWSGNSLTSVYRILKDLNRSYGTLALFPMRKSQFGKFGAVEYNSDSMVTSIIDKDPKVKLTHAWGALRVSIDLVRNIDIELPHIGYSVEKSIALGFDYTCSVFDVDYFDCGTFDEYRECLVRLDNAKNSN